MTTAATLTPSTDHEQWTLPALFTVIFLGVTAGVQMSDMGLQAVSLSEIQRTFGVNDASMGALQGLAGVLVGSALAIPLSRFADRFSRKRVLLCLIAASTAMMVLSAFAPNFPLFFLGRSAAGITEFAMVPLVYSMIPDLAPERHRVLANLGFAALMAAGASLGFYYSGAMLAFAAEWLPFAIAPWRKAFLLLSMAGIPLLLLGAFTLDPVRKHAHGAGAAVGAATHSLLQFLRQRWQSIGLFVGMVGCMMVAVQGLNQLITLALERRYSAVPAEIGHAMGLIVLLTSVGCLPIAGGLDRLLAPRLGKAVRPLIMGVCIALALPVVFSLTSAATLTHAFWTVGVFLFMTCIANALVPTMLQDLAPPTLRARCFALWSFVVSVFIATGPLIAGQLSDRVFDGQLLQAIVTTAVPALVLSLLCAIGSFRQARRDALASAHGSV